MKYTRGIMQFTLLFDKDNYCKTRVAPWDWAFGRHLSECIFRAGKEKALYEISTF